MSIGCTNLIKKGLTEEFGGAKKKKKMVKFE